MEPRVSFFFKFVNDLMNKCMSYIWRQKCKLAQGKYWTKAMAEQTERSQVSRKTIKNQQSPLLFIQVRGVVASWLVRSTPERAVQVQALAGDTVLCFWARHFTLTVPLSTQVYKWVPANFWGNLTNCVGVTCDGLASRPGEVEITSSRSMLQKPGKAPTAMGQPWL